MGLIAFEVVPYAKVTGTGEDDTKESSQPFDVEPDAPYAFSCTMRHAEGPDTGVAVISAAGSSMYWRVNGHEWTAKTNVFMSSSGVKRGTCTVRQWHVPGELEFRNLRIERATPRYRRIGDMELGFGESIDGNMYRFGTLMSAASHNHSRATDKWINLPGDSAVFGKKSEMRFTHELAGRSFLSGSVGVVLEGEKGGGVTVSLSVDGREWVEALTASNVGVHRADVPASMLPAKRLFARVTLAKDAARSRKMRQYSFDARVDGAAAFGFGATDYFSAENGSKLLSVKPWEYLSDTKSGELLDGAPEGVACWAQSSGRKVFRGRPAPKAKGRSLSIAAARNEAEAAQLVVRADRPLKGLRAKANLPQCIEAEVRRVGYLLVDLPMDDMGARGLWPDPIFDQEPAGCDISAGENQPFWITVKPRKGTKPGLYKGTVELSAESGMSAFSVPVEVRVFGFDFPDRMTCETAFGLTFKTVFAYHHAKKSEDKAAIAAKYLDMYARHHITPYSPMYGAATPTWTEKWSNGKAADSMPTFAWDDWDATVVKAIEGRHFNTFRLPVKGKGSGEPLSRRSREENSARRKINGVIETNALFEVFMDRYLKGIESHLREKGWLDEAYIYAFDEPHKEDFDYMKEDLGRFRKYAPSLRRMVTMAPNEDMYGYVNLWCPITQQFNREKAWARQALGEEVWWYITFSSKPPKVNEHVEHAGVDMRVWLWQTWLEKVTGVLIWETVCWNRPTVYPDPEKPQNPYEDTIVWARDRPWNTGEGRYVYPPRRCFETKEPVIEGPVDSIRFEMLREGVEDYEYFAILKRLAPKSALLEVPRDVTTSLDDYSRDPAAMERHRTRLGEEIERCSRR